MWPAACNGTAGQWAGCRGNGCSVCAEKLTQFPNYFKNHPSCVKNTTCAGQFFTCNAKCPAPTDADRATSPNMCDGVAGGWQGCRGTGCWACSELTDAYPYYFANHPSCTKNVTCDSQFYTCSANCPAPTVADKQPTAGTCNGTSGQWAGCRGNGCTACSEKLTNYPYYFLNHPRCLRNDACAGQFFTCNSNCPAPTDGTRRRPACNGTSGQWAGCPNGCGLRGEAHRLPELLQEPTRTASRRHLAGQFFTCNSTAPPRQCDL